MSYYSPDSFAEVLEGRTWRPKLAALEWFVSAAESGEIDLVEYLDTSAELLIHLVTNSKVDMVRSSAATALSAAASSLAPYAPVIATAIETRLTSDEEDDETVRIALLRLVSSISGYIAGYDESVTILHSALRCTGSSAAATAACEALAAWAQAEPRGQFDHADKLLDSLSPHLRSRYREVRACAARAATHVVLHIPVYALLVRVIHLLLPLSQDASSEVRAAVAECGVAIGTQHTDRGQAAGLVIALLSAADSQDAMEEVARTWVQDQLAGHNAAAVAAAVAGAGATGVRTSWPCWGWDGQRADVGMGVGPSAAVRVMAHNHAGTAVLTLCKDLKSGLSFDLAARASATLGALIGRAPLTAPAAATQVIEGVGFVVDKTFVDFSTLDTLREKIVLSPAIAGARALAAASSGADLVRGMVPAQQIWANLELAGLAGRLIASAGALYHDFEIYQNGAFRVEEICPDFLDDDIKTLLDFSKHVADSFTDTSVVISNIAFVHSIYLLITRQGKLPTYSQALTDIGVKLTSTLSSSSAVSVLSVLGNDPTSLMASTASIVSSEVKVRGVVTPQLLNTVQSAVTAVPSEQCETAINLVKAVLAAAVDACPVPATSLEEAANEKKEQARLGELVMQASKIIFKAKITGIAQVMVGDAKIRKIFRQSRPVRGAAAAAAAAGLLVDASAGVLTDSATATALAHELIYAYDEYAPLACRAAACLGLSLLVTQHAELAEHLGQTLEDKSAIVISPQLLALSLVDYSGAAFAQPLVSRLAMHGMRGAVLAEAEVAVEGAFTQLPPMSRVFQAVWPACYDDAALVAGEHTLGSGEKSLFDGARDAAGCLVGEYDRIMNELNVF